ncbi:DUF1700 domain-containing protein [Novosphingobium sp. G106]|uniref:DUF1700 domain-containing protein n=1 Tax=Novosphingobium sp. G106 TaxID=2849500 RepID=UPI001C2CFD5F|nr:DUF1700 domain-containing protein [Novosphingobium sp. G106]MBV1689947.1 DUF1700 domain-containing protein [Novosphingobium sp. G106]
MTRDEFLKRLRRGLEGMSPEAIADAIGDYEAHFDAAREDGRSEAEVAEALGDPGRLARELRLEAGIKRWEEVRSPSSATNAVIAFLGLGAIDILVLLPILLPAIGVIIGLYAALLALFIAGGVMLVTGPFSGLTVGPAIGFVFGGLGMMSAAVAFGALLSIVAIWLVNGLLWFGRLHYRVIEPAIKSDRSAQ